MFHLKIKKAVRAFAVATVVAAFVAPAASANTSFTDVRSNSSHADAIHSLVERGIIKGFKDGSFHPNENVTRGQAAKIIAGALGLDTVKIKNPGFTDVPTTHQYYGAIAALANAGVINGYEDGSFGVGKPVQRNHMAKIISGAFKLQSSFGGPAPFTDVRSDYKDYITALYENGVTTGKTVKTFDGASNVTRGQLATFVVRAEKVAVDTTAKSENPTGTTSNSGSSTGNSNTTGGRSQLGAKLKEGVVVSYFIKGENKNPSDGDVYIYGIPKNNSLYQKKVDTKFKFENVDGGVKLDFYEIEALDDKKYDYYFIYYSTRNYLVFEKLTAKQLEQGISKEIDVDSNAYVPVRAIDLFNDELSSRNSYLYIQAESGERIYPFYLSDSTVKIPIGTYYLHFGGMGYNASVMVYNKLPVNKNNATINLSEKDLKLVTIKMNSTNRDITYVLNSVGMEVSSSDFSLSTTVNLKAGVSKIHLSKLNYSQISPSY